MWPFKKTYKTYHYLVSYMYIHKKKRDGLGRTVLSLAVKINKNFLRTLEEELMEDFDFEDVIFLSISEIDGDK